MTEKYIAEINAHEMALRLAEASMGIERPIGMSAEDVMIAMREKYPNETSSLYRMALAAGKYLEEAINNYQRIN